MISGMSIEAPPTPFELAPRCSFPCGATIPSFQHPFAPLQTGHSLKSFLFLEKLQDADGTVTPHMNQLKAEPVYDLSETNPCEVAGGVSGTRGKIGGGDGRSTGEKMSYTELDACSARVITRGLEQAKRELYSAIFDKVMDVADK